MYVLSCLSNKTLRKKVLDELHANNSCLVRPLVMEGSTQEMMSSSELEAGMERKWG